MGTDQRSVRGVAGVLLCLLAIAGYLIVAPDRDPSFETWGLSIKALQTLLLALLVHAVACSVRLDREERNHPTRSREHAGRWS